MPIPGQKRNVVLNGQPVSPVHPGGKKTDLGKTIKERRAARKTQPKPADDGNTIWTAAELMALDLPEPQCIVHNLLTEGLNILASRPKLGKSWLALQLSLAVSGDRFALGSLTVSPGDVLYLAMEDNRRRLKNRLSKLLAGQPAPERLELATQWRRMDDGGMDQLKTWLKEAACPRLIVIDTLAKVRSLKTSQADRYMDDYKDLGEIHKLAEHYGVAILVVHHTRKAIAEDAMDDVSGSIGITAAADTILLLRRDRGKHDACLSIHGRDIDEQELGLKWDAAQCCWSYMGNAKELRMSEARRKVLECVQQHGPITPKGVAELLGEKENNVKQLLFKMAKEGVVKSDEGEYRAAATGNPDNPITESPLPPQ